LEVQLDEHRLRFRAEADDFPPGVFRDHQARSDFIQETVSVALAAAQKAVMNHRTPNIRLLWG